MAETKETTNAKPSRRNRKAEQINNEQTNAPQAEPEGKPIAEPEPVASEPEGKPSVATIPVASEPTIEAEPVAPQAEPVSLILTSAEIGANLRTSILSIADETSEKAFNAVHLAFTEHLKADRAACEAANVPFDEAAFWANDTRAAEIVASAYLVPDGFKADGITPKYKIDTYARRIVGVIEAAFRCGIRTYDNFKLAVARHRGSVGSFIRETHSFLPVFAAVNQLATHGLMRKAAQQAAYRLICGEFGKDAGASGALRKLFESASGFELTTAQVKTVQATIKARQKAARIAKLLSQAKPDMLTWDNVFTITFEASKPSVPEVNAPTVPVAVPVVVPVVVVAEPETLAAVA